MMFLTLFHSAVFILNCYTLWFDYRYVEIPFPNPQMLKLPLKARSTFLTFWCLVLQTAYFAIAIFNDLFGTNDALPRKRPAIRAIKDALFCIAFPVATYVPSVFWSIYLINRELVFPKILDEVFPAWCNHVMHSTVFIFMVLELVMCSRKYLSNKLGISIIFSIAVIYKLWMYAIYLDVGSWVYPFLNELGWLQRVIFFTFNFVLVSIVWHRCRKLNDYVEAIKIKSKNRK